MSNMILEDQLIVGDDSDELLIGGPGDDTILGAGGDDSVDGRAGADELLGGSGNDSITGGAGNDTILGSSGDDIAQGAAGRDRLDGGRGNDTVDYGDENEDIHIDLRSEIAAFEQSGFFEFIFSFENAFGGSGNDTLIGTLGDNLLRGGGGNDSLDGGDGDDTASYANDSAGVVVDLGTGTANGSESGNDTLTDIENTIGGEGADTLTGDDNTNDLSGGGGNDVLDGGGGSDNLDGGGGNDILKGDPGSDSLDGGDGNDTADYGDVDTSAAFDLGTGTVAFPNGTQDQIINIENIIATSGDDTIIGSGQAELLDGAGGNDVILDGGGNDTVLGGDADDRLVAGMIDDDESDGDGDDVYEGGDGNDTISYENTRGGVNVDLGTGAASGPEIGVDTLESAENAFGGSGPDTLTGSDVNNLLCGNDGGDTIDGSGGNDTLIGGGGNDTIDGGDGNDLIYGDSAAGLGDVGLTISFVYDGAYYRNTFGVYDTSTHEARILIANVDVITNPALVYYMTALPLSAEQFDNLGFFIIADGYTLNSGANESLNGGDPTSLDLEVIEDGDVWKIRDTATGYAFLGEGNPAYFTEEAKNPGGLDHVMTIGDLLLGGDQEQRWEELPNLGDQDFDDAILHLRLNCGLGVPGNDLLMGGDGNDTVFGNQEQDTLMGGIGNDMLDGNAGNDNLDGGEGNDTLEGGEGGDTLRGGSGADTVHGGGGDDLIIGDDSPDDDTYTGDAGDDSVGYEGTADGVGVDLDHGKAIGSEIGSDALDGIENAIGGAGNDTLIGNGDANELTGNGGNDTLDGGDGNDTLDSGEGDDLLDGGGGEDTIQGGNGNDTVSYADDTASVNVDLGDETASGAESGSDILDNIENALGGSGSDTLTGDALNNVLCGNDGGDTINGALGDDTLIGGGGDDTIDGGGGNDLIYGDSAAGIGEVGLKISFVSESAGYRNTYGRYDINTLEAQILVANVDVGTNPVLPYCTTTLLLTADQFESLGFFLIPNGYGVNGTFLNGTDPSALNLEVVNDGGVWQVRDTDSGYIFAGAGSNAFFTEASKNFDGLNHVETVGDLSVGGKQTQGWEDLVYLGDQDFEDAVFELSLPCGLGLPGNDILIGGAGNDTLFANDGMDTLEGDAGDDRLNGNGGNDSLDGGVGNDSLDGGEGADTLEGGVGMDTVDAGGGDDLILGNGSADNDIYNGDTGTDTISYEDTVDDVFVDLEAGSATGTEIGTDALDAIESALGGAGNDALIGNTDANKLVGNGGNDSLIGGGGDDTLEGGGGDDTVSYADDTTGVTVDLGLGEASGPDSGNDTLSDIENAAGGAGNDTLVASGDGNKLIGNDGKDSLIGGTGDDTLDGGDGDDEILSGIGNDSLIGGEGADTFTFDLWNGTDTISDFEPAGCGCAGTVSDKIDVSAFGFTNPFEFAILLEPVIDGTWINLSETGGGDVFLDGVNILALNLDDFIF